MTKRRPLPDPALLRGARVRLRPWRAGDRAPFAAINADPLVMKHFPAPLARDDSDALADHIQAHFDRYGFGPWVVEIPGISEFAGVVGLLNVSFEAHFTPAVEIAWRLAPSMWGQGYATEAAACALRYGFHALALPEIVAFTVPANLNSLAVMRRLGMHCDMREDFPHPRLPAQHPLRLHRLYRISRAQWMEREKHGGAIADT
ncbi:GNAT family N-acetyltransferase [Herbaspirillum sp. SJZ099]|uniref:GNAT family N-acetyltransferase n=1 Tax=Herbaspirillum sp. SJZ099 TaxID=2572916 RepID=UPI0011A99636|nr:GNAT family N-acetyltransferase [Herbaspirillum sp. SJZ099]TWC64537.1 ribosomal-protein-alanine N-acetyltransferase [Herbaspirillum sp. SJZ099]